MIISRHSVTTGYQQLVISRDIQNIVLKAPQGNTGTVFLSTKLAPSSSEEYPLEMGDFLNLNFDADKPTELFVKGTSGDFLNLFYQ